MNKYEITMLVDEVECSHLWSGYTEQGAIAQMMLYEAQNGARSLKVLDIKEIN